VAAGGPDTAEWRWVHKDGTERIGEFQMGLTEEAGETSGFQVIVRDITERKKMSERLMKSLQEKEVLLREVHHRVKNNLQVISSLLDMSSLRIHDQYARDLITNTRSKIHSMAIIHSQLYASDNLDQIDVGSHIHELIGHLIALYAGVKNITTSVEVGSISLGIPQAVPYAVVLNELITNALKHAFKGREKGTIEVGVEEPIEGTILTRVKDDGIGVSPEFDIAMADTMGLKLVRNVVQQQLKGKVRSRRDKGTEFIIEFER
jgi:two-component sensor histidine kinase